MRDVRRLATALVCAALVPACTPSGGSAGARKTSGAATTAAGATAAASGAAAGSTASTGRGGMMGGGMSMMRGGMSASGGPRGDTSAAPPPGAATFDGAAGCPGATPALLEQGRQVFASTGNCYACHGANAHGTSLAPNLTDSRWLDIDGSYGSIVGVVQHGVRHARTHPAPMPALGGAKLDNGQVCAVAAYVYSLSHQ